MNPLDRLSEYLGAIERRLRLIALTRGIAVTAGMALALTIVAVLVINQFAFSNGSVIGARVFLFLGLAFAIAAALIIPVIRLNRRNAARRAEARYPQFEERLLTFTERIENNPGDPFLALLADDTLRVAEQAEPKNVAKSAWIYSFSSAAVAAALALIWLGSAPGFLGYGTSLLWAGLPKGATKPFYSILVDPGNRTVRKRSDQLITAHLTGFTAPKVRFFAKYSSASQWEQAEMATEPGGTAYQFMIAGVPENLEYYVEAGGVKSSTYKLSVVDLPGVKKIRVTYHYPSWLGLKDEVEDPGGDLRAVEGTKAEVAITTDKPLASGVLMMDDGSKLALNKGPDGLLTATVPIQKDGQFHIAALEGGDDVRLSEDYFIEAQRDKPPEIKMTRPGRDFKASPIEEVTVQVEAKDDFGLKNVELHYSVNGGAGEGCRHAVGREDRHRHQHHRTGRFQSGAGRRGQHVRAGQGRAHQDQHRYLLHRGAAVRTQLHAIPAGGRRWRRWRRRRGSEPDLQTAEGNHRGHLESVEGRGRQGQRCRERRVPGQRAVQTARPGQVAGRPHEGPPVDRCGRFLQELRQGYGNRRGGHGARHG